MPSSSPLTKPSNARFAKLASLALIAVSAAGWVPAAHADEVRTLVGAGVGAVAGAAIGHSLGGRNAAIVGAGAGGLIGASIAANQGGYYVAPRPVVVAPPTVYVERPYVTTYAPAPVAVGYYTPPPAVVYAAPQPYWRADPYWHHGWHHHHHGYRD